MLVLSRRINERIVIDNQIMITILAIDGDKVKVGIEAPREITVLREELWQAILEQEQIAHKLAGEPDHPALDNLRQYLLDEQQSESPPADDPST
jgi:carbon storage regulator